MAYDALGQASAYRDPTGITTQTYAARGMLATVATPSHPHGAALTYGFDANGQRTRAIVNPLGRRRPRRLSAHREDQHAVAETER